MNKPELFSLNLSATVLSFSAPTLEPLFLSFVNDYHSHNKREKAQRVISFYECCEFEVVEREYNRIKTDLNYKLLKNKNSGARDLLQTLEYNLRKTSSYGSAIYSVDPTNQKITDQLILRKDDSFDEQVESNTKIEELEVWINGSWSIIQSPDKIPLPQKSSPSAKCSPIQYFKYKQRFYHYELRKKWLKTFSWLFYYWSLGDIWAVSLLWEHYRPSTPEELIWSITPHYCEINAKIDPRIDQEHYIYQKTLNPELSQEEYLEQWGEQYYENNFEIVVPDQLLEQIYITEDKSFYPKIELPKFDLVISPQSEPQSEQNQVLELTVPRSRPEGRSKKVLFLNLYPHKSVLLNRNHDPVPFFVDLAQTQHNGWDIYVNSPHPLKSTLSKVQSNLITIPISWDQILDYGYDYFDKVILTINLAVINNLKNVLNFKKEINPLFPLLVEALKKTKTEVQIPDFGIYHAYNPELIPNAEIIRYDPFVPPFEPGYQPISIWSKNYELISNKLLNPTVDLISNHKVPFKVTGLRYGKKNNPAETRFHWMNEKEPLSRSVEMLGRYGAICLVSQSHPKSVVFKQNNLEQLVIKSQRDLDALVKIDSETETELRRRLCTLFL